MDGSLERALGARYDVLDTDAMLGRYGIECGDGWFALVEGLCAVFERYARSYAEHEVPAIPGPDRAGAPEVRIVRLREKWGELRAEWTLDGERRADTPTGRVLGGVTEFARVVSRRTCEACGSTRRVVVTGTRRVRPLCPACRQRRERDPDWAVPGVGTGEFGRSEHGIPDPEAFAEE